MSRFIYRKLLHENLFSKLFEEDQKNPENFADLFEIAMEYGLSGNLIHSFLALQLASAENIFTVTCKKLVFKKPSLLNACKKDLTFFYELFHLPENWILPEYSFFVNYDSEKIIENFPYETAEKIDNLGEQLSKSYDLEEFFLILSSYYHKNGSGMISFYTAFHFIKPEEKDHLLKPILNTKNVLFSDIIGYDTQKRELCHNTENFLKNTACHNTLLYGESGTGKSTSIKALLSQYAKDGLKIIEVYKHQVEFLPNLIDFLRKQPFYFIIYMDDLSFEEYEIEYKYLKAVIEGSLETRPKNVLIYATSNRRHLVKESWNDRNENSDDINQNDTVQEKLSLANRFGLTLYYPSPEPKEFREMVKQLAKKFNLQFDEEDLLKKAHAWEIRHGGLSGRTAEQFITYISGQ